MAPTAKLDPTEPIAVAFVDSTGVRHEGVRLPRHLLKPNVSLKARERYLISSGQLQDPSAPAPSPTVEDVTEAVRAEQVAADFSVVEQLRQQLDELQGRLDGQPLSHAELVSYREELAQFQRDAIAAQAQLVVIEGRGSQLKADLEAIVAPLNQQAAETARQQQENNEVQARVLEDLQAQANALLEALSQDAAAAAVERDAEAIKAAKAAAKTTAREVALDRLKDMWGPGVTVCPESPAETDDSFSQRWWGRAQVEGDGCLQVSDDGITVWRYAGGEWLESSRLEPQQRLINQQLSVLDQSTKQTTIQNISAGGGGGSGGERLLASAAGRSSGVLIADSSNWRPTGQDPQAGQLLLCITAADGSLAGRKGYAVIDFVYEASKSGVTFTEHSILGDLADVYSVGISVTRSAASVPTGVTVSMPSGATATRVFLRIDPQGGTTGGVNNFLIEGLLLWVFTSQGRADAPQNAQSAAWVWQ